MSKRKNHEVYNKFLLRENFIKDENFEDNIKENVSKCKRKFPNSEVKIHRNKNGARIIAYEKSK